MLDAGTFEGIEINTEKDSIKLGFSNASQFTQTARLLFEQPTHIEGLGEFKPAKTLVMERGAAAVLLKNKTTWIELINRR